MGPDGGPDTGPDQIPWMLTSGGGADLTPTQAAQLEAVYDLLLDIVLPYGTLTALPIIGEPIFIFSPAPGQPINLIAANDETIALCLAVSASGELRAIDPTSFAVEIGIEQINTGTNTGSGTIAYYDGNWLQPGVVTIIVGSGGVQTLVSPNRYRIWARMKARTPNHAASVLDVKANAG